MKKRDIILAIDRFKARKKIVELLEEKGHTGEDRRYSK